MVLTQSQLEQLRPGDYLTYHGVEWQITDYSTYEDPNGYQTEEWLLNSASNKQYYLMREVDPDHPQTQVHWYIAEEIKQPHIFQPGASRELTHRLWESLYQEQEPYPELEAYGKTYQFESKTKGRYGEEEEERITWDYWDKSHQWNLAIEAWADHSLCVYLTKVVQPQEFSRPRKGFLPPKSSKSFNPSIDPNRQWQIFFALLLTGFGLILMFFG